MSQDNSYSLLADPGIRQFMIESDKFYPPDAVHLSVSQQREVYNNLCAHFQKPRPSNIQTTDLKVAGRDFNVPIRIYSPRSETCLPVVLYFHGGGFVVGDLESHDDICAEIADQSAVNVIAVDYRLAPEHPFPAPFDDCITVLAALPNLARQFCFDSSRLVICGDSAGGNLTAAICLDNCDKGEPVTIAGQVLIYPGLGGDITRGSYIIQANAPGLSTDDIVFFHNIYAGHPGNPHRKNKLASPLLETDYSNLPSAFIVAAHFDPLHDDCFEYAERLQNAGVIVQVRDEPLLVHSFLRARHMSQPAAESFKAIIDALNSLAYKGKLP